MKQANCNSQENDHIRTKMLFFILILPLLSFILLIGVTSLGAFYVLEQGPNISPFRIRLIAAITLCAAVSCIIVWVLSHYYSIRYMHIPVWRWIVSGFRGEPNLPWMRKATRVKPKEKKDKAS